MTDSPTPDITRPALSIVVPAYDDADRLPPTIDAVLGWLDARSLGAELLLVDDGSSDATPRLITARAGVDPRVVPVLRRVNGGKGAAIRSGVEAARGQAIVFFDSDLSYPLDTIDAALARLADGADLAIGVRDLAAADSERGYALPRRVASQAFNALVRGVLHLPVRDTQCGFKAFRAPVARALFDALTVPGFGFDVELLFLAGRWGLRIDQVPVTMKHDADRSSVRVLRHGTQMAGDVLHVRWRALRGRYPSRPETL